MKESDLRALKPHEAIKIAIIGEEQAIRIYKGFSEILGHYNNLQGKAVFDHLCRREMTHLNQLNEQYETHYKGLKSRTDLASIGKKIEVPEAEEIDMKMDMLECFRIAITAESKANRFYSELEDMAEMEETKRIAHRLAEEELSHKILLESMAEILKKEEEAKES